MLNDFIKSLNPKDSEKHILFYNSMYKLWRDGKYIGVAIWTNDSNIGDSFQVGMYVNGKIVKQVFVADKWALIINKNG